MLVVGREQMQKIDTYAIEELKIPSLCLVERASLAILKNIDLKKRKTFAIIVGVGNNGADGIALARNLLAQGLYVEVYIVGSLDKASSDFRVNYEAVIKLTDRVYPLVSLEDLAIMEANLSEVSTIVEGIFGTGLNRTIKAPYSFVIEAINRSLKYTISIDIPSGLDATAGKTYGAVVDADLIVSMEVMKKGVYINSSFRDKCLVEDIGIPKLAIDKIMQDN
ncbi:NAD(P)H-hydrate epimerase [Anaerococcus sp. AGMB09787]|uniref:NAD(P)H-hydrate epimerase n=1 Tax=Anaerococcus sp. AGMB09787 TaxID=2922869 RepID=UPI001FAECD68|nr:NAD(P)H-hydrate epimerase [Anaerococcus sp. AGMB09787]